MAAQQTACDPASSYAITFRRGVDLDVARRALTVRDVTSSRTGTVVVGKPPDVDTTRGYRPLDGYTYLQPAQQGYGLQPPATTWRYALSDTLQASDGQTLDYPWVGAVENTHERPVAYFSGSLWEADLTGKDRHAPFVARNVEQVARWVMPATARDIMPRLLEMRNNQRNWASVPMPISQALRIVPDAVQAHAADLSNVLSPRGTGLAWVGVRPGRDPQGRVQRRPDRHERHAAPGDEPRRLREGQPAGHARVRDAARHRRAGRRRRRRDRGHRQSRALARTHGSRRRGDGAGDDVAESEQHLAAFVRRHGGERRRPRIRRI